MKIKLVYLIDLILLLNHKPVFGLETITWEQAYKKASIIVDQMSLEQKVTIMTGSDGPCVGNTQEVKGLFPSLCYQDGPIGVS